MGAFHNIPSAGRAGAFTSPPAPAPPAINSGSLAASAKVRLFSVDVRDSSDRAACAAEAEVEAEVEVEAEGYVVLEAETMRAKRGR